MRDGQLAFEGSMMALENILNQDLYIGLIRKRGEPDDDTNIDDLTEVGDLLDEEDDAYFEEIDDGYERVLLEEGDWSEPQAPDEPSDGWGGEKPAMIVNLDAIEFGPWDDGHIDDDGNAIRDPDAEPDEISHVFLTDDPERGEGKFIAYYDLGFDGEQVRARETLRIPPERMEFRIS